MQSHTATPLLAMVTAPPPFTKYHALRERRQPQAQHIILTWFTARARCQANVLSVALLKPMVMCTLCKTAGSGV